METEDVEFESESEESEESESEPEESESEPEEESAEPEEESEPELVDTFFLFFLFFLPPRDAAAVGLGRFLSCFLLVVVVVVVVVVAEVVEAPKKFSVVGILVAFCVAAEAEREVAAALRLRICAPYFL